MKLRSAFVAADDLMSTHIGSVDFEILNLPQVRGTAASTATLFAEHAAALEVVNEIIARKAMHRVRFCNICVSWKYYHRTCGS